jgi:hypothetical protein
MVEQDFEIVREAVKHTGTIDQMHIDLTLVAAENRAKVEKALRRIQLAILKGELTRDEALKKLKLSQAS